jgi:hypothetical protein
MLKQVKKADHPLEARIHRFLCSPDSELSMDPKNHCVPLLAVLDPPDQPDYLIFVMKLLRAYDEPDFDTVGEVVDFFQQIFEVGASVPCRDASRVDLLPGPAIYSQPSHRASVLQHATL